MLAGFVIWELRTASPMLDVRLFRIRRFTGASFSIALVFFALFGAIYFLTQYLQGVLDYTPLQAGVRMLPVAGRPDRRADRCRRSSPAGSAPGRWSPPG